MIQKLIRKFKLNRIEPLEGDIYYGDVFDFVIGKNTEQFLYGMRDVTGYERLWEPVPSARTVRFTIDKDQNPTFRCIAEVLCTNVKDPRTKAWLRRVQFLRIDREQFKAWILDGVIGK